MDGTRGELHRGNAVTKPRRILQGDSTGIFFAADRTITTGFFGKYAATREESDGGTISMKNIRTLAAAASAVALWLSTATAAHAGSTNPVLVIGQATASGGSPSRIVDLLGSWGFEDLMQIDYPLNVVVSQGTSFVRYAVGDAAVSGTYAGIADGLSVGEILALEASGAPTASASIARLALHEMTLTLPGTFASGSVDVVLYVSLPGEGTFLSNTAEAVGEGS